MIELMTIRLANLVLRARDRLKAYTDRNDIHQQVILDLYESHIALAETVRVMCDMMEPSMTEARLDGERLAKVAMRLANLTDLLVEQGVIPGDPR